MAAPGGRPPGTPRAPPLLSIPSEYMGTMHLGHKRVVVTLALVALVAAGLVVTPDAVLGRAQAVLHSPWFPVVLLGLYVIRPFLAWPITALAVLVGYRYGILLGVPVALAGAVVSTLIPYAAVRYFDMEADLLAEAVAESERYFDATGDLRGLLAARIAPVPAEAASLVAGAGDVEPSTYVVGTLVGEIPWAIAAVTIGHSMSRLTVSNVSYSPWLVAATVAAALLLVAGPTYKVLRRSGDEDSPGLPRPWDASSGEE